MNQFKPTVNYRKGAIALIAIVALLIIATTGIMAATNNNVRIVNAINTSGVDLTITDENKSENILLTPGKYIDYPITITNTGDKSWLRVQVLHTVNDNMLSDVSWIMTNEELHLDDLWLYKDGYFYYKETVDPKAEVSFNDIVSLPVLENIETENGYTWKPVYGSYEMYKWQSPTPDPTDDPSLMTYKDPTGGSISLVIKADVIQADNFTPDFASDTPWGDTPIQKSIYHATVGE